MKRRAPTNTSVPTKTDNSIYGRKPILEVLKHAPELVEHLSIAEGANFDKELAGYVSSHPAVTELKKLDLEALSGTDAHQGIIAKLKPRPALKLSDLIDSTGPDGVLLVLDCVSDPQNLGSIFRAADASGCSGVIMTKDRSAPLTPAVAKASIGASVLMPSVVVGNLAQALKTLKKKGIWIIGSKAGVQSVFEVEVPRPAALIMGSEEKGLRRLTEDSCDLLVGIPQAGRMQSLNVGQASAVLLFELMRQNGSC